MTVLRILAIVSTAAAVFLAVASFMALTGYAP